MKQNQREFRIAVVSGDGIGPEITVQAVRVIARAAERYHFSCRFDEYLFGGCSIDRFGTPLTEEVLLSCRQSDAVLLGAVGGPEWEYSTHRPEEGLLRLRKELAAYTNLRPVRLYAALQEASPLKDRILKQGIDIMIVRELMGGMYFSRSGRDAHSAYDTEHYEAYEIDRVLRQGFEIAGKRGGKLCLVDKANVLESSKLWRECFWNMAEQYPEVSVSTLYVDNAAMQLILHPEQFDVIVTSNMFGDILSDEAAVLSGSIGLLPSASIGSGGPGIYEPIHGSAPDLAGKNTANPIGSILSAAMLLRYSIGCEAGAAAIEAAVEHILEQGYRTADIYTGEPGTRLLGTNEIGEWIAGEI